MRKIYITLGVLLAAMIVMAYLYFSNLNIENSANDTSLSAASKNATLIFAFENEKSFYEILSGQDLLQQVLGQNKSAQLKALKDEVISIKDLNDALDGQKVYVSILPGLNQTVDYLISTQFKANADTENLLLQLKNKGLLSKKDKYYQLKLNDSLSCYIGLAEKLVLISNGPTAILNVLNDISKPDSQFINYIKANNRFNKNTLANLYINFNHSKALLKNIVNSNINGELSVFDQNTYAALSYNFSKEKLLFNGHTDINDENSFYQLFKTMPEQKNLIVSILPSQTANYTSYSITDYPNWRQRLKAIVKEPEAKSIEKQLADIKQNYRIDLNQVFNDYFKNQLITFQLKSGEKFGAINLKNGDKVGQLLLDLTEEYAPDVRIFKAEKIPYAFFGEPFKKFERPFYTIIDNYMVIANNASSIQSFLNSYKNNQLLINDDAYMDFSDQLSNSSTICFYVNHKNSTSIFSRNLIPTYFKYNKSANGLKDFNAFCYQLSADNGRFISNLLLFKDQIQTDTAIVKISP